MHKNVKMRNIWVESEIRICTLVPTTFFTFDKFLSTHSSTSTLNIENIKKDKMVQCIFKTIDSNIGMKVVLVLYTHFLGSYLIGSITNCWNTDQQKTWKKYLNLSKKWHRSLETTFKCINDIFSIFTCFIFLNLG